MLAADEQKQIFVVFGCSFGVRLLTIGQLDDVDPGAIFILANVVAQPHSLDGVVDCVAMCSPFAAISADNSGRFFTHRQSLQASNI